MNAKELGNKIKRAVRSKDGEEILDYYRLNLWTEGGCWALAKAIHRKFGGKLFAMTDPGIQKPFDKHAQHVVVKIGSYYLDGDGAQTKDELVERWEYNHSRPALFMPLEDTITKDINCSLRAVNDICGLFAEKIK